MVSIRAMVRALILGGLMLGFGQVGGWCQPNPPAGESGRELTWVSLQGGADMRAVRRDVLGHGGEIVSLTPERRLLVRVTPAARDRLAQKGWAKGVEKKTIQPIPTPAGAPAKYMGLRKPTAEEQAFRDKHKVTKVAANDLSSDRALLQGLTAGSLPATVDNSLSQYFPPIGNQSSQGSCASWACGYYYNTYCYARREGLNASGRDENVLSSPAFLYNLCNDGVDTGSSLDANMFVQSVAGCCCEALKRYRAGDALTWPTEAAWVDALKRRTVNKNYIGSTGSCSEESFLAIKQMLANGDIVVTDTSVYSNWYDFYPDTVAGIDNQVLFANSGGYVGAHGLTIVGYDDNKTYRDGTGTQSGAFLLANQWGSWGAANTGGTETGYMWVAYNFFKSTPGCFGFACYSDPRPAYRSRLYAVTGLNHPTRNSIMLEGGMGPVSRPLDWVGPVLWWDGGANPIDDTKRVAVDLTDSIGTITDWNQIQAFIEFSNNSGSDTGTITSADFYQDFDGDGLFSFATSTDTTVTVAHNSTGYATATFGRDYLMVTPNTPATAAGPTGGLLNAAVTTYTLTNTGTAPIDWMASADVAWLTPSPATGTLGPGASTPVRVSLNPAADSLAVGTFTGHITISNVNAVTHWERPVILTSRPITRFAWSTIASPQGVNGWIDAKVTALDEQGGIVRAYSGDVSLSAIAGGETSVGSGTTTSRAPFATLYHSTRYEIIYLASELGAANQISSAAFDVTTLPAYTMQNFTLRLKHTTLNSFPKTPTWDTTGWTTVYQGDLTINATGWNTITFQTPFAYNGSDDVIFDFSFDNGASYYTYSDGFCRNFTGTNRVIFCNGFNSSVNPTQWDNTNFPPLRTDTVPNMRVFKGGAVSVVPASFHVSSGEWNGQLNVQQAAAALVARAVDTDNHSAVSNPFDVIACPAAQNVTSTNSDGTYGVGTQIDVQVAFSEAVTVSGAPTLTLETGTTDQQANYSSGSGTTTLVFRYTVVAGDSTADLDYRASTALALNGGTITATAGTHPAAILTLPTPGTAGSLGANKALVIAGTPPTLTLASSVTSPTNSNSVAVTATFDKPVTGFGLDDLALANATADGLTAISGAEYTFNLHPQAQGTFTVNVLAGAALDGGGNPSLAAAAPLSWSYDSEPPIVTISSTSPGLTNTSPIPVTINFSEPVTGFEQGDLVTPGCTVGGFGPSGGGYAFNLIPGGQGTVTVDVGAGAVIDAAGNPSPAAIQLSRTYRVAPNAPSNPRATAISMTGITWTWSDNSGNETGFKVWANAGAGPCTTQQTTTTANVTSWAMPGLSPNAQYSFQVAATNGFDSARTNIATTYTLIEPVAALSFSEAGTSSISVATGNTPSNLAAGASGVRYENATKSTGSGWQQNTSAWISTGLSPNTRYTFSGKSRNGAGVETAACSADQWTAAAAALAPVVNNPHGHTLDVAIAAGDGNPAATEYAIYCETTAQWIQADGTLGAAPSWATAAGWAAKTVTGLTDETSYAFRVRARNGESVETANGPAASAATSDITPPNHPVVTGTSPTVDLTPTWSWTPGGGGNGTFRCQLDSTAGSWTETMGTSWTPASDLIPGAHALYVEERDAAGNWSEAGSFAITITIPGDLVWVKFDYAGIEAGTQANPFNTMAEGLGAVDAGGTVRIYAGSAAGALRITKQARLEAFNGPVRLGSGTGVSRFLAQPPSRNSDQDWILSR